MHIKRHLAAAAALAFALAALTGSALAAPPSDSPGAAQAAEHAAVPAQQTQAPGQEQKAEQAATPQANAGQEQKAEQKADTSSAKTQSTSSQSVKTQGVNSSQKGIKPSNDTAKNTLCTTGSGATCTGANVSTTAGGTRGAGNDFSKRYGDGTTAADGIVARGGVSVDVYGPGNSQPHKVCKKVTAGGKSVWSDWHSVKAFATSCTATASVPGTSSTQTSQQQTSLTSGSNVTATGGVAGTTAVTAPGSAAAGGVAGVSTTQPGSKGGLAGAAGGVAGALAGVGGVAGAFGTLPFTGFPLWAVILIAVAVIAIGWTLVRHGRPATTRDIV